MRRAVTVQVDIAESMTDRDCVTGLLTSFEYLIVATEAPDIGKV